MDWLRNAYWNTILDQSLLIDSRDIDFFLLITKVRVSVRSPTHHAVVHQLFTNIIHLKDQIFHRYAHGFPNALLIPRTKGLLLFTDIKPKNFYSQITRWGRVNVQRPNAETTIVPRHVTARGVLYLQRTMGSTMMNRLIMQKDTYHSLTVMG